VSQSVARRLVPHFGMRDRPISSVIYGTVSVVALIVVGTQASGSVGRLLVFAAVSMVVIWGVHVYASVLAEAGASGLHWRSAAAKGLHDELGVLEGAAAPLLILVLGAVGALDEDRAVWYSVWCGVLLLALLPLVWLRRRGSPWLQCVAAAAISGFFGLLLVVLKAVVH
jgi:hypothetical protein